MNNIKESVDNIYEHPGARRQNLKDCCSNVQYYLSKNVENLLTKS